MSQMLDARLSCAAALVRGGRLADVGTDHGYLPVSLLLDGKIKYAVASDINRGPLESARQTVARHGLSDKVDLVLTDDEFEAIADEDNNYLYYAESYGENNFRTAYQFNKLFDTLLDPTEEDGKVSYAGKYVTKVTRLTEEEYDAKYPETDSDDTVTE